MTQRARDEERGAAPEPTIEPVRYEPPRLVLLGNARDLLAQNFGTQPDSLGDACNQGSCD